MLELQGSVGVWCQGPRGQGLASLGLGWPGI